MSVILSVCTGWSGDIGPFTLRVDGVPFNLSGFQVELILRRGDWSQVTLAGTVNVLDQGATPGQVTYSPAGTDFTWATQATIQIYHIHWKVTDVNSKVVFFPNDEADQIRVYQA